MVLFRAYRLDVIAQPVPFIRQSGMVEAESSDFGLITTYSNRSLTPQQDFVELSEKERDYRHPFPS